MTPEELLQQFHATDQAIGASEERPQSPFWRVLDIVNRPYSAIMGGVSGAIDPNEDVFANMGQGWRGERTFGGQDVLEDLGVDPNSKAAKWGGLALDIINPLDPLNYIGVGALTKAGKAARNLGNVADGVRLAAKWGDQANTGQRALLSYLGKPIIGGSGTLQKLQDAGNAISDSAFGMGIKRLFGGKQGYAQATARSAPAVQDIVEGREVAARLGRGFEMQTDPLLKRINKLGANDRKELTDLLVAVDRGDLDMPAAYNRFANTGHANAAARKDALDAASEFYKLRKSFTASNLQGTGIDPFASESPGFLSRVARPRNVQQTDLAKGYLEPPTVLQGASDNALNRALVQPSTQPPMLRTLSEEGQKAYQGEGWYSQLSDFDKVSFLQKYRKSPRELNALDLPVVYEEDAVKILEAMRSEAAKNVNVDSLVKHIEDAGQAQPWTDAVHANGEWVKIDQGRWAGRPIAIPADMSEAFKRVEEAVSPSPDKAAFGSLLSYAMPQFIKDLGLMQWWKGTAIYGGLGAYFARNAVTGFIKNGYEGLSPTNPQTYKLYTAAARTMGGLAKKRFGNEYVDLGGVRFSLKRLWQEYKLGDMAGGGMPDPDIMKSGISRSAQFRQKVFKPAFKTNEAVEMFVRMPLMMKVVEDTVTEMRRIGMPLPAHIGPLKDLADEGPDFLKQAFKSAQQAVYRAHFDYTDLAPFERALRDRWIPFYTWMRKNIPSETVNMIQQPGKYMPWARAYYQRYQHDDVSRDDVPEWMSRNFAVPMGKDGERNLFLDATGFLPMMDVVETVNTLFGKPRTGQNRASELIRYAASRFNPFVVELTEQGLQKDFLTGRAFSDETPKEFMGVMAPGGAAGRHALDLFRPASELDRLNPGNVFTKLGQALGNYTTDTRPHRNEAPPVERLVRAMTGIKVYGADQDVANMSQKTRRNKIRSFQKKARRLRAEGLAGEAEWYEARANELRGS